MALGREEAEALASRSDFVWHQRFDLGSGVLSPGVHDIEWLLDVAGDPMDLTGMTVLDIGTANGAAAFIAERRGAQEVVAVDVASEERFGFREIADALGFSVRFQTADVYRLPETLQRQFDVVFFFGVLYHLRHPLLALDNVRRLTGGTAWLETAVADADVDSHAGEPVALFYRGDGRAADGTNWLFPTTRCMVDWCISSGLEPEHVATWPDDRAKRAALRVRPVDPEFRQWTPERPISVNPSSPEFDN